MAQLSSFLTALWVSGVAAQFNILTDIGKGVQTEVQAVVDPIGKGITFIGSSQCSNVKKLVGVDYDSYETEPDLSKLTLDYISSTITISYNLSVAAELIPLSPGFNVSKPLRIFLHGFTDDPTKESFQTISKAFYSQDEYNILALDASSLIRWLYLRSTTMVRFIGQKLGELLVALVNAGLDRSKIYLIGHSLGAHIAGFAGRSFLESTGERINRISGLDPAGPCFSNINATLRLTKNYADFVDIIHSDAGVYGLNEEIGHVDFYPNSGSEQPNCLFQTCSHSRAWQLYAESVVNTTAFIGIQCSSWTNFREGSCEYTSTSIMGYSCPTSTRGKYYLQTNGESPYGRGIEGITYVNNAGLVRNVKYVVFT